jgi:tetratricopeptide (TPR) repeat protein
MTTAKVLTDNHLDEAIEYYKEALSILEQSTSVDHQIVADCLIPMGNFYSKYHMLDDRLQCLFKVLDLYRRNLPCDHINIANIYRDIAFFYQKMKNSFEAVRYFNESLSVYRANYGPEHHTVKLIEGNITKLKRKQEKAASIVPVETNVDEVQSLTITLHTDSCSSNVEHASPRVDSTSVP